MEDKDIKPIGKISGEVTVPGDKSVSHRAVMLGSIAEGTTDITNILDCDDCNYTIRAFRAMGVKITSRRGGALIEGRGMGGLKKPENVLYVGESGTTMRLLAGILAGQKFESIIDGAGSLKKRPMDRITEPLSMMGSDIKSSAGGLPPLAIKGGKLKAINYRLPVASAQVKSAVLLAGLYAEGTTVVEEMVRSRDHTERALKYFGANIRTDGLKISIDGLNGLSGKNITVPGDISSAAFFVAAATIIKGSSLKIKGVGVNPTRSGIIDVLLKMGADISLINKRDGLEPTADIIVRSAATKGIVIDREVLPSLIDELPAIFAVAAVSKGETVVKGAGELRVKETDRITSMEYNLKALGAGVKVSGNDIVISGVRELRPARLKSFGDHRTCMASMVAALAAKGPSTIDDTACVSKSFPEFFIALESVIS